MISIRLATPDDRAAINALLRRTLGAGDDPRYDRFLEWKHRENPFGPSYEWVATDGGAIVGYRSFLRWELIADGEVHRAVRAVDTATDPAHQGRGIFRSLTLAAVEHMTADGVSWVFNTPNDSSRPGYLKMGWVIVGQAPVAVVPRTPLVLRHLRSARQPADRWSYDVDVFADAVGAIEGLDGAAASAPPPGIATHRTPAFLRWRYGHPDLHYRAMRVDGGAVVFRVRRRGPLREALVADVLGGAAEIPMGRAVRAILRATRADVAVITGDHTPRAAVSIGGPQITWRALAHPRLPAIEHLHFTGGDLELF